MRRGLEKLISEKEKLFSKFHQYELALREYIQIIPLSTEQTTQLNDLFFNVAAFEKLSNQLDKEYEHSFIPKETSKKKTRPKVEATQSNPGRSSTTFVKTSANDAKNQRSNVSPISLFPEKYGEYIVDLKDQFFTTLAVVHLVSKITFNQGRGKLAYIYIQKLKAYKDRLKEANISLSEHEINSGTIDDYIKTRRQDEKEELERLDKCIDNVIFIVKTYGEGEKEFYQVNSKKDEFNKVLYFFKKELVPETIRIELIQKGFLSGEVNKEDYFSQIQKLEARLRENKLLLDNAFFSNSEDINAKKEKNAELQELLEEKYVELERISTNLRNSYIAGQRYTAPHYETIHLRVLPLISVIPTVTVVPVISIAQPFSFFQLSVVPVVNAAMISEVTRTVNNPRSSN